MAWRKPAAVPVDSTSSSGSAASRSTPMITASSSSSCAVVVVSRIGQSWRPSATTASASLVIALSGMTRDPCAARPRAMSLIQTSAFSPVCSRYERVPFRCTEYPPTSLIAWVAPAKSSGWWSTTQCEPKTPPFSSSAKNATTRSRAGMRPAPRMSWSAPMIIASMFFMSTAPRPHSMPSRTTPPNGSTVQFVGSAGTTSVCPCTTSAGFVRSAPSTLAMHARAAGGGVEIDGARAPSRRGARRGIRRHRSRRSSGPRRSWWCRI